MLKIDQRIILVTRKTRQQELKEKFGTTGQAHFYVARARAAEAGSRALKSAAAAPKAQVAQLMAQAEAEAEDLALEELSSVESEDQRYQSLLKDLRRQFDLGVPVQVVDRGLVPNLVFGPRDVVVVLGQDGLVANVAKYAVNLPIIGINPDPARYDGILLPFEARQARSAVQRALEGRAKTREVSLAAARLNNGQRLLAFNDLFVGARSHVSARYRLESGGIVEQQSSSGMIVSTGAGSTGWLSSVFNMLSGVAARLHDPATGRAIAPRPPAVRLPWEARQLVYVVREPFISKMTTANLAAGLLDEQESLVVESLMGPEGTIFSDGIEADALPFSEGAIATISLAKERARLVVP